jgi:hypothetical protein
MIDVWNRFKDWLWSWFEENGSFTLVQVVEREKETKHYLTYGSNGYQPNLFIMPKRLELDDQSGVRFTIEDLGSHNPLGEYLKTLASANGQQVAYCRTKRYCATLTVNGVSGRAIPTQMLGDWSKIMLVLTVLTGMRLLF